MENFPDLSTLLSVGSAVIVLTLVLNTFLFKPLRRVIDERQARSDGARRELDEGRAAQARRLDEIEARLREARREAHEIREQALRAGRARRDELMSAAREEAQGIVEKARGEIAADLETARNDLESEAERLAGMIAERVLGRPMAVGGAAPGPPTGEEREPQR